MCGYGLRLCLLAEVFWVQRECGNSTLTIIDSYIAVDLSKLIETARVCYVQCIIIELLIGKFLLIV